MIKKICVWMILLVFILSCILAPNVNAKTFKIGSRLPEGDINLYLYTSGGVVSCDPLFKDYVSLIFDGNESTGVNNTIGSGIDWNLWLSFPNPINVSTITAKPTFGGGSGKYTIQVAYKDNWGYVASFVNGEKTFKINCTIETLYLSIIKNGTNEFYFNDIIINYTPISSEVNSTNYQPQINQINQDLNTIQNDIDTLEVTFDNFTNIEPSEYNDTTLRNEFQNQINLLNGKIISLEENVTAVNNKIPTNYNDSSYNDSTIKDLINDLDLEIKSLKEDLIQINKSIPLAYDDSALKSNIFKLDSEDKIIIQKIGNLTIRIENLTTELEKLSSEVQNIQSKEGVEEGSSENNNKVFEISYYLFIGVIIIILLLIILMLSFMVLKKKSQMGSKPTLENGIYSNVMHEILFKPNQQNANEPNDELSNAMDNKYKNGDMSEKTYNSLKNLIQNLEQDRQMK